MSDWSNLEDIMQDLSLAQGYAVPGRLEAVPAAAPPPIHVPDEASVERSYYESFCVEGGNFDPPDYEQIKLMLDLVKINEEENDVKSSELIPRTRKFRQKEKIKINVALSSIEEAKEAVLAARRPIAKDIIPTMFKKKIVSHIQVGKEKPSQTSQPSLPERTQQYTPSANADVYYSKYLQRSMLKEQIAEDIWVKAEKQMKEIEARQKLKAELTPKENGNTSPPDNVACGAYMFLSALFTYPTDRTASYLALAEHRHLLSNECMVCIVAAKHGHYF